MNLKLGSKGTDVITVQAMLNNRGYSKVNPDGDFGVITSDAIKDFQKHIGLPVDGIVNDHVFDLLRGVNSVPIKGIDVSYWQQNIDWKRQLYSISVYDFSSSLYLFERPSKGDGHTIISKKELEKLIKIYESFTQCSICSIGSRRIELVIGRSSKVGYRYAIRRTRQYYFKNRLCTSRSISYIPSSYTQEEL